MRLTNIDDVYLLHTILVYLFSCVSGVHYNDKTLTGTKLVRPHCYINNQKMASIHWPVLSTSSHQVGTLAPMLTKRPPKFYSSSCFQCS